MMEESNIANAPVGNGFLQGLRKNAQHDILILGLTFAAIYGIGAFLQFSLSAHLGVGSFWPGREAAIASGVAFLLFFIPALYAAVLIGGTPTKVNHRVLNWIQQRVWARCILFIASASFLYHGASLTMFHREASAFDHLITLKALGIVVLMVFFMFATWVFARAGHLAIVFSTIPFMVVSCVTFASSVNPYLKPMFGGFTLSPVIVDAEPKEISGYRLLVTSDDKFVVVADCKDKAEFWRCLHASNLSVVKIPWEQVKSIRSVPRH